MFTDIFFIFIIINIFLIDKIPAMKQLTSLSEN